MAYIQSYTFSDTCVYVKIMPKDPILNFYCRLDDEKMLVLGAWPVMQKSVLKSLDNYHTVKTH